MSRMTQGETTRRKHLRLQLHEGITAELRIIGIGQHSVHSHPGKVMILNLSPGGLRMATSLTLADEAKWRVTLQFALEGYPLEVRGVVCYSTGEQHWKEYGVCMDENPLMRLLITRALNLKLIRTLPALSRIHQLYRRDFTLSAGKRQV